MSEKQRRTIQATVVAQAREAVRTAGVHVSEVRTYASRDMWCIIWPYWDKVGSYLSPVEDEGCYAVSFVPREAA